MHSEYSAAGPQSVATGCSQSQEARKRHRSARRDSVQTLVRNSQTDSLILISRYIRVSGMGQGHSEFFGPVQGRPSRRPPPRRQCRRSFAVAECSGIHEVSQTEFLVFRQLPEVFLIRWAIGSRLTIFLFDPEDLIERELV